MSGRKSNLLIVQIVTLSRAVAALFFISIALISHYRDLATIVFIYACLTDFLDGYLARKLCCTSSVGATLDLFGDKFLTIISLLFAIAMEMPVLPCALAILREVFLLSMRSIRIEGKPLFPPQRLLGTLMIIPIWSGVVLLLQNDRLLTLTANQFNYFYWAIGILSVMNFVYKLAQNWKLLIQSFNE